MARTAQEHEILSANNREDAWWIQPLFTVIVLTAFIAYATFRTFENNYFLTELNLPKLWAEGKVGHLLSPFYSPLIITDWVVFGKHVSPAILILIFPLSFRLTCYYYRKAYYRSFFWNPPACAVKGPIQRKDYKGEKGFPFVLQNVHRFTMYIALIFIFILSWDVVLSMQYSNGWGISFGTLILLINVILLGGYTFGCHSFRHLIGGNINCFSCSKSAKLRHGIWGNVTALNERHALFAWASLVWVALSDFYVRLVCTGAINDPVFIRFG